MERATGSHTHMGRDQEIAGAKHGTHAGEPGGLRLRDAAQQITGSADAEGIGQSRLAVLAAFPAYKLLQRAVPGLVQREMQFP